MYSLSLLFQHNFKKLRNNISKSSLDENATKCLTTDGQRYILWEHFKNAFNYDQGKFSFSLHEKLTADHFDLNPASKMRNHLAEEVLDKNMLSLMKVKSLRNLIKQWLFNTVKFSCTGKIHCIK